MEEVLHLGDIISPFTVRRMREALGSGARVVAVLGNNDGDVPVLSRLFHEYGWELLHGIALLDLGGSRYVAFHGFHDPQTTEIIAKSLATVEGIRGVLFGHTHRVLHVDLGGKILLNPGEACGYLSGRHTYAILDTSRNLVEIREVKPA